MHGRAIRPGGAARTCHNGGSMDDHFRASLEAYLLGALEDDEGPSVEPDPGLREHVLELARAPREPIDLSAYTWDEVEPGVRVHVLEDDPVLQRRSVLVWARPGARMPRHRHLGDEEILVLRGRLLDERDEYGPGDVCRSRTGSVHHEEVAGAEDCVCYVVYHGGHEAVDE
jgi:quercetin dioxygenase-like cupin family protein